MGTVSVLINCYNSAATLAATLDSALAQTYPDLEIIIFDNGSRDATPDIVKACTDPRIRYHRRDTTIALGEARNAIMALAQGRYLAFLDSDDLWIPDKIGLQVRQIERTGVGIVFTDAARHHVADGSKISHFRFMSHVPSHTNVFGDQLRVYTVVNSSVLFCREALYRQEWWVDSTLRVCTDFDLFMRLIYCDGGDFIPEQLTIYTVASGSTMNSNQDILADEMSGTIDRMLARWPEIERDYAAELQAFRRNVAFQRAKAAWRNGRRGEARRLLAPFVASPRFFMTWIATILPFATVMQGWALWQRNRRT